MLKRIIVTVLSLIAFSQLSAQQYRQTGSGLYFSIEKDVPGFIPGGKRGKNDEATIFCYDFYHYSVYFFCTNKHWD